MKLGEPLHALLGPDGKVLGDGISKCLSVLPFPREEVAYVARRAGVEPRPAVVVLYEVPSDVLGRAAAAMPAVLPTGPMPPPTPAEREVTDADDDAWAAAVDGAARQFQPSALPWVTVTSDDARPRRTPYTERGVRRVPCARCGRPSSQQWQVCADGNRWRGVCSDCDVALNALALRFMRIPGAHAKAIDYRRRMTEAK